MTLRLKLDIFIVIAICLGCAVAIFASQKGD